MARATWRRRGKRSPRCRLRPSDTPTIRKRGTCSATCAITATSTHHGSRGAGLFRSMRSPPIPISRRRTSTRSSCAYRYGAEIGRRYADAYLRRDPRDFEGEGIRLAALRVESADAAGAAQSGDRHASGTRRSEGVHRDLSPARQRRSRYTSSRDARCRARRTRIRRAQVTYSARQSARAARTHPRGVAAGHARQELISPPRSPGLGLIPPDSADKLLRPCLDERNDAFLDPDSISRDGPRHGGASRRRPQIEKIVSRDTSASRRAVSQYVASSLRAYAALAKGDTVERNSAVRRAAGHASINIPFDAVHRSASHRPTGSASAQSRILERHGGARPALSRARARARSARRENWRQANAPSTPTRSSPRCGATPTPVRSATARRRRPTRSSVSTPMAACARSSSRAQSAERDVRRARSH